MKQLYSIIVVLNDCIERMVTYGNITRAQCVFRSSIKELDPQVNPIELVKSSNQGIHFLGKQGTINLVSHKKH